MRLPSLTIALLALSGCGSGDAQHGGGGLDLAIPDMSSASRDLYVPTQCSPTDPMTDGTPCNAPGGCPANTIGVSLGGSCKCYSKCATDPECSCNRFCDALTLNDASAGNACLPGNAPAQRCGRDPSTGAVFGTGLCGQLTVCVNADAARLFRYCSYKCSMQADCPAQTTCQPLMDAQGNTIGNVCAYNSGPNGNKDLGQACTSSDTCKTGQLCDGQCRAQCNGPGAACASGSCQRLDDAATGRVVGYVCK